MGARSRLYGDAIGMFFGGGGTKSFGTAVKPVAEGVGGAIGRSTDEVVDGHRLIGNHRSVPSQAYHNQVIRAQNAAKTSATSKSNQVFVGNRHPGLSPGVEDFTGLNIPEGAVEWMTGGKQKWLNYQFLQAEGSTKANPKFITFQDLVAQHDALPKGSKKNSLKKKIDGYKSGKATPWAEDVEDIIRYQKGNESGITAELKRTHPELFSAQLHQSTEFHHWSMKEVEGEFWEHVDNLYAQGKVTEIDLINLHNLNRSFGFQSGSRKGAALPMQRGPHNWMHKGRTIPLNLEPKTTAEAAGTFGKTPISKMRKAPAKKSDMFGKTWNKIFSEAEWAKVRKSGATTLYDLEEIANWKSNLGIDGSIKRFKKRLAEGKTYTPDGKSEMQRTIDEFKSMDNIAELTEWKKQYNQNVVAPMMEEATSVEDFAKDMSPMDLHRSNQWGKNEMADELEGLRFNKKKQNLEDWESKIARAHQGKGVLPQGAQPPNPELEELLPNQLK